MHHDKNDIIRFMRRCPTVQARGWQNTAEVPVIMQTVLTTELRIEPEICTKKSVLTANAEQPVDAFLAKWVMREQM